MTALRAALAVEDLKLRRATAPRVAALAVGLGAPAFAAAATAAVRADLEGPFVAKMAPMLTGTGWAALLGLVGELLSVGLLLAVGVVVSWSFGREFTDGTFGALFALPTPRRTVALAKVLTLAHWAVDVVLGTLAVTAALGFATGLGVPDAEGWAAGGATLLIGLLTTCLALPLAYVASSQRGYLPGIGALLGVIVVTQVLAVTGVGAWFPYAAPGMWSGMGGAEVAATVTPVQLALAVPMGLLGVVATLRWWDRAEVV